MCRTKHLQDIAAVSFKILQKINMQKSSMSETAKYESTDVLSPENVIILLHLYSVRYSSFVGKYRPPTTENENSQISLIFEVAR